jgi:iron complex outermembrane receptor protein
MTLSPPARPARTALKAVAAAAAALLALRAAGQDPERADLGTLDLEALLSVPVDTVSAASKHEESVETAPASVSILTRRELRDLGYRTLGEALAGVRGLFTTYDRTYTYVGLRGFQQPGDYNIRVLLLVDGHPWNDDIWDSALLGPEFGVDLDLVERIEVVRGPGSSMYGANALFGIVNVVTRSPESLRTAELTASGASGGAYGGRASAAFVSPGGAEGLVSVSGSDVAGQDLRFPAFASSPGGGWAHGRDWERWGSFLAKSSWHGITLEVAGVRRDKGDPTGSFGVVFDDPRNQVSDRRLFGELRWTGALGSAVEATVRGYVDAYEFREWYAYAPGSPGGAPVLNTDADRGRWFGAEVKTVSRLGGGWLLVAGVEGKYHPLKELLNYDVNGAVAVSDRRTGSLASAYAQLEIPAARWLRATVGGRFDRVDTLPGEASPRLALVVTPRPGTALKALYGRAFRAPNQAERYYAAPGQGWKANPSIRPESVDTYELAVEQDVGRALHLVVSGYRYDIRRLIGTVVDPADGLSTYANTAEARALGVEAEARLHWRSVLARCSVAVQRAEDAATGATLPNAPSTLAKLHLTGPLGLGGLRGGAELLYMSRRLTLAGAHAGEHVILNLNLVEAALFRGALDVSIGVRNALGASYADPAYGPNDVIAQDGRTWRASATWRF